MTTPQFGGSRLRAYLQFLAAILYFFLARSLAHRGAIGLVSEPWEPLVEQAMLVFLLVAGYAAMGTVFDRELTPVSEQGLPARPGWSREAGLGLAAGWGLAVACVVPAVVVGGIAIVLNVQPAAWGWLVADACFFMLAALAEEVAFRGYGFQRFAQAMGPQGAMVGYAAFYAILQALVPGSSRASIAVSAALSLVLSTAYLRTRALWVSWGMSFGWKAVRGLVFGLTIAGVGIHSPVVQGNPMGPFWLTGGGFGLDGSWVTFVIILAFWPVVYRITRDLDFRYNAPVIVPGGIAVDLEAAARNQHDSVMAPAAPAGSTLVQIQPLDSSPAPAADPEDGSAAQSSGRQPSGV